MFPRYRHTPIFDSQRKRCPICNLPVYSLAGIHPQCAIKLEEGPRSRNTNEPAAEGEAPVLVTALVAQVVTNPVNETKLASPGPGIRSRIIRMPAARTLAPAKPQHQKKK